VFDSNVIIYLITEPETTPSARLWKRLSRTHQIVMPALARWEIANAFYRIGLAGKMSVQAVDSALVAMQQLAIRFEDGSGDHLRAIHLARQFSLKAAYDAHFLALAERLDCELWTADKELHRSVTRQFPWVRLVER
jgi:predicted nucleic acid-binding protein